MQETWNYKTVVDRKMQSYSLIEWHRGIAERVWKHPRHVVRAVTREKLRKEKKRRKWKSLRLTRTYVHDAVMQGANIKSKHQCTQNCSVSSSGIFPLSHSHSSRQLLSSGNSSSGSSGFQKQVQTECVALKWNVNEGRHVCVKPFNEVLNHFGC